MKFLFSRFLFLIFALWNLNAFSAESLPVELQDVGINEHLGQNLDLNLSFKNELGQDVLLKDYFDGKTPVVLTLVYYQCPNLCNFLLNGFNETLKKTAWTPGKEFKIITLSINPTEGPELAEKKKTAYLKEYGRPEATSGWHFLTGEEANINKVSDQVGFKFKYDQAEKQYAHTAAIFVLTPDGKISRYLYGIQFNPRDLRLALLEASNGKIGNIVDRFLMFCYHYDPKGKKYAMMATNMMKVGAAITILLVSAVVFLSRKKNS